MDLPKNTSWSELEKQPKGTIVKFYCHYFKEKFPKYPEWIDWMLEKEKKNDRRESDNE